MRITPSKGRATGYSDFYKSQGSATPGGKLAEDAKTQGARPSAADIYKNRTDDTEDEDKRKAAIRRRLTKKKVSFK